MNRNLLGSGLFVWVVALVVALQAAGPAAAADRPGIVLEGKDGPGKGKHIVFVTGDEEYRSEEGLPQLAKILAKHHGFKCTVVFAMNKAGEIDPNTTDNLPGLEALDTADLMVILTRFRNPPEDQMKHVVDYINSGKPIIGLRTATHAFSNLPKAYKKYDWGYDGADFKKGFGRQVLGETWVNHWGHHGSQSTRGVIVETQKDNPLLRGVDDIWGPTDVYEVHLETEGNTVLVLGQVLEGMTPTSPPVQGKQNEPMMPVVWSRQWKNPENGKTTQVLATTMGAATDLQSEGLRRLIVNGAYVAVGLTDKIPAKADVSIVGQYEPTKFGFGQGKKGKKPADLLSGAEDLVPATAP